MATKSLIVLVCVVVSATLMMEATNVEAQLPNLPISPLLGNLFGIVNLRGLVFCSGNGTLGTNGTSIPIFPNATVQLRCGNEVLATVRTNNLGIFSIVTDILQFPVASILSECNIVVTTPLVTCNANLPSTGGLISTGLQQVSTRLGGILSSLAPTLSAALGNPFSVVTLVPISFIFNGSITSTP